MAGRRYRLAWPDPRPPDGAAGEGEGRGGADHLGLHGGASAPGELFVGRTPIAGTQADRRIGFLDTPRRGNATAAVAFGVGLVAWIGAVRGAAAVGARRTGGGGGAFGLPAPGKH